MTEAGSRGTSAGPHPPINHELIHFVTLIAETTPGWSRVRRAEAVNAWAEAIVAFSQLPELRSLEPTLAAVVDLHRAGRPSVDATLAAIEARCDALELETLLHASRVATEQSKRQPLASFILAWLALSAWVLGAERRSEDLHAESRRWPGWPDRGWLLIPAACITTALRMNGLTAALELAERAHAVLETNRRRHMSAREALVPAIEEYRRLARKCASRCDAAVAELADDLLDAIEVPGGRTRALVAALLWTVGLVGDCEALRVGEKKTSRATLRALVRISCELAPSDPLLKRLWLAIEEAGEIAVHEHEALHVPLAYPSSNWRLDVDFEFLKLPAEPSRIYAHTLEALLTNTLEPQAAYQYMHACEIVGQTSRNAFFAPPPFVVHRFEMLKYAVGRRLNLFSEAFDARQELEWLEGLVAAAARVRQRAELDTRRPDAGTRMSLAMFELLERTLEQDSTSSEAQSERARFALEKLEKFRGGALHYWLNVIPPLPSADETLPEAFITRERQLLDRMRGSYFLAIRPSLPLHFWWSNMDAFAALELSDPARRAAFYSDQRARQSMTGLEAELDRLSESIQSAAPRYASLRLQPNATVDRLTAMLAQHRGKERHGY